MKDILRAEKEKINTISGDVNMMKKQRRGCIADFNAMHKAKVISFTLPCVDFFFVNYLAPFVIS